MGKYKIISVLAVHLVLFIPTIWGWSCPTETSTGTSGSLNGGSKYGCSEKTYDINFGTKMAVKMTWISFNDIPGDMPYCTDGYIKVYAG